MRYHRADVVERALAVLDTYGPRRPDHAPPRRRARRPAQRALPPLRQQAAAARGGRRRDPRARPAPRAPGGVGRPGGRDLHRAARRDAGLPRRRRAGRDGPYSFGLGATAPYDALAVRSPTAASTRGWCRRRRAPCCTSSSATSPTSRPTSRPAAPARSTDGPRPESDFAVGLAIVLDGIRLRRRWPGRRVDDRRAVQLREQYGAGQVEPGAPAAVAVERSTPARLAPRRSAPVEVGLAQRGAGEVARRAARCR